MATPRVLLIVNPAAGVTRGKQALYPLTEGFCRGGWRVSAHVTGARGEAQQITQALAREHDLVVCCGGDGTLGEVINGLMTCGAAVPLGYVPTGSTNDFANSLKLTGNPAQAVQRFLTGSDTALDVGCWNGNRYFSYIASFGAFTAASYNASQATKNALGHFAYVLEGIKELSAIRPHTVTVTTEERTFTGEYVFGAVSNSTSVAGLVKLDRRLVDMSDGLFEVVLVRPPQNAADLSKILGSLQSGKFDPAMFEFFKASRVHFALPEAPAWSLDGEQADGAAQVTVENRAGALLLRR